MSDFNFPYSLPNRSSSRNDLGFGTILGSASPVSPRWSYLRDPPWPEDEDDADDAPRRGAAPNVEPPPGSPEYQAAEASLPEPQAGTTGQQIATAGTLALGLDTAESQVGARLAAMMARAAPAALATAPPVATALPLVAFPAFNSGDQTLPLGDRFRVSQPPGQAAILERRISEGL